MAGQVGLDCQERQAVVKYELGRLEGLAAPAYARFLLWLVMQVRVKKVCLVGIGLCVFCGLGDFVYDRGTYDWEKNFRFFLAWNLWICPPV